jgi:hypothetical protein
MAITTLVDGITGVGPTGQFLIGPNTIAPYAGTSVVGLTDGTSAATASKNVAEIYNEIIFDKRIIIEKAGLTFDPADNSQLLRAIQKLANYSPQSFGKFASVLAPTLAPTEANPQIILSNNNGEVFAWAGDVAGWVFIGNTNPTINLITGSFPTVLDPKLTFDGTTNPTAPVGAVTNITNPSSTRSALLEINGWNQFGQSGTTAEAVYGTFVFVNGVFKANLNQIGNYHTGSIERESGDSLYINLPAGQSVQIGFAARSSGNPSTLFTASAHVYKFKLQAI